MFRVRGLVCIVFLLALLIGGSTLCEIEAWAEGISYRGMSKCEGLQLEVSFIYDSATSTIKDFTSTNRCIVGEGGARWAPKVTIEVKKDGNFYYEDRTGNFVKGVINPDGNASGDLGPGFFAMMCGDGKSYHECANWTASPAK